MSQRVSLPPTLSASPTLQKSTEGVTVLNRPSLPASASATATPKNSPTVVGSVSTPAKMEMPAATLATTLPASTIAVSPEQPVPKKQSWGWDFNVYTILIVIAVPVIVWLILVSTKWNFVTDLHDDDDRCVNHKKLFLWTVVISIIIYVLIYLIWYFWKQGKSVPDMA